MVITDLNIIQEKHLKAIHLKVGFVSSLPKYEGCPKFSYIFRNKTRRSIKI
jgi:hypothetical protein